MVVVQVIMLFTIKEKLHKLLSTFYIDSNFIISLIVSNI